MTGDEHDLSVPTEAEMEDLTLSPTGAMDSLIPLDSSAVKSSRPPPSLSQRPMNRDVMYGALFAVHCFITMIMVLASPQYSKYRPDGVPYIGSMVIVGTIYNVLWVAFFFAAPKDLYIRVSTTISFAGIAPMALVLLVSPSWTGFFVSLAVLAIAFSDYIWTRKNKLGFDFVAVVFELVVDMFRASPALVAISAGVLAISSIWAYWCCQLLANVGEDEGWSIGLLWLLFHFYWTSHLFKTLTSVVVSGAIMYWYHHWGDDQPESPTVPMVLTSPRASLVTTNSSLDSDHPKSDRPKSTIVVLHYSRIALTSVFGSVCLGALCSPIAHFLWTVLRMAKRDGSYRWLRSVVLPVAPRIDAFTQVYHKYTFSYVAAYSQSFHAAAAEVWTLFEERGIEAMVDDDLTSRMLLSSANGCAGCMGTLAALVLFGSHLQVYGTVLSFMVGYSVSSTATTMLSTAVKTLFVCFAQNPDRLSHLNPIIYHRYIRLSELKNFKERRLASFWHPKMMLSLRRGNGESAWKDHCMSSVVSVAGLVHDGGTMSQLSAYTCPNHSPGEDTLVILCLPGAKRPSVVATGQPVLRLAAQVQQCFPTLIKVRPLNSFESDTESDEDKDAVKERKRRKLQEEPESDKFSADAIVESYCALWEPSVCVLGQDELSSELELLQVDTAALSEVLRTNEPSTLVHYVLARLPPVVNSEGLANFGILLLHSMQCDGLLSIATPVSRTIPTTNVMHTNSVYTFNGQREATECGAGKTAPEMVDNIRRRHASGTFTKMVPPAFIWPEVVALFESALPIIAHFEGDLRLRKVMQVLPMGPLGIRLEGSTST
ncbi:transmembrane protein [Achlya hypogyna]|uniref:Transmembrane protein n=1 Tax=Achlya hypogyna TaxID=1202772 RepID=A0A1V9ZMJ9_ACHHY|nr:transmembrane protein [Achlya hypogyna]